MSNLKEGVTELSAFNDTARDADQIYRRWWKEVCRGSQVERRHAASHEIRWLVNSSPEHEFAVASTLDALHHFTLDLPQGLDWGYSTWAIAMDLVGQGAQSTNARQTLEVHLGSIAQRLWLKGRPEGLLRPTLQDPSHVSIPHPDRNVDGWTTEICHWQRMRRERIIVAAVRSRFLATRLLSSISDDDEADLVKDLEHDLLQDELSVSQGLGKVGFVAACIALRGCAAYLVNGLDEGMRRRKLDKWLDFPRAYLSGQREPGARTGGDDFSVRWNAALLIRNLVHGPWNETSEALFDSSQWIY